MHNFLKKSECLRLALGMDALVAELQLHRGAGVGHQPGLGQDGARGLVVERLCVLFKIFWGVGGGGGWSGLRTVSSDG